MKQSMKQSKVFFNDETHLKIETLKLERKQKGIIADKVETNSFIIEDYFRLIAKIKTAIEDAKGLTDNYLRKELLDSLLKDLL